MTSRARRIESVLDAVGNTPMVRIPVPGAPDVTVYAKLESANPGGSVKDRAARRMILDALADGRLGRGKTLIDSTSGNTGVAYSMFGAALGIPVELVMPENVSRARKDIAKAFGTKIIFSDPLEGSDGAIRDVTRIVLENPDKYFFPNQYANPSNPKAHYEGTAVEILRDVGSELTHFVAGVGTSGTMMGTARRLHEHTRKITCVAVQPDSSMHGLEGLKHMASSLVPKIYDPTVPDETMFVRTEDGWDTSDALALRGLHIGHSSGANVFAATKVAERLAAEGKPGCIVCIVCDRGDRYFAPMKWDKSYVW
jgi:cysteine synthase B